MLARRYFMLALVGLAAGVVLIIVGTAQLRAQVRDLARTSLHEWVDVTLARGEIAFYFERERDDEHRDTGFQCLIVNSQGQRIAMQAATTGYSYELAGFAGQHVFNSIVDNPGRHRLFCQADRMLRVAYGQPVGGWASVLAVLGIALILTAMGAGGWAGWQLILHRQSTDN